MGRRGMEIILVVGLILGLLLLPRLRMYLVQQAGGVDPQTAREQMVVARVRQIKYFFIHAGLFVILMLGIAVVMLALDGGRDVLLVGMGWGILLALHAFWVFGINGALQTWEERRVQALLRSKDDPS